MPRLFLLDGHSLIYKAFHAIGNVSTASGELTGAVFGFMQIFHRIRKEYQPTHIAVVFDPKGHSFRQKIYADYKAHRPPQPPELTKQLHRTHQLLRAMRVPMFEEAPYEADDILASLARWAVDNEGEAVIVSVDKDLLQCVRPGVMVLREHLGKIEMIDEAGVVAKMGVKASQVASYLALLGDSSDNIPGVPGVGAKTAAQLLSEYPDVEAVIAAAAGKTKPKYWTNIAEHAANARLSLDLATVRTDFKPSGGWKDLEWEYKANPELRSLLRELEFRALADELGGETLETRTTNYETVSTAAQLERVVTGIRAAGRAAIDTETTGLDPLKDDLVGISLSWQPNQAVYIPVQGPGRRGYLAIEQIRTALDPLLSDPAIRWTAHHWNFDFKILNVAGFHVDRIAFDTMIAAYLLNPDRDTKRLKDLALEVLGIQMTRINELIGAGDDLVTMADVNVQEVSDYACQDADVTLQLDDNFAPRLEKSSLTKVLDTMEMPLIPVLARMELEGVRIDRAHFKKLSSSISKRLEELTREIHAIAGRPFNINSPKQLGEILFDELKLPTQKKTRSGYSTDVTVLEELASKHPLPAKILDFRENAKLLGTYVDALPQLVNSVSGRIHTSFSQTTAATGRLSSSDPNLQNIPVRTELGREIRRGFVAREGGWQLLGVDYSQIELRILAHLSGDEALVQTFREGGDIHVLTASRVFKVPPSEVTKDQRGHAKTINFGIIYGMSAFRLARDLEIPRATAEEFIAGYFDLYKGVKAFIEKTLAQCKAQGFVTTMCGRRRLIPDIKSSNFNLRSAAERVAVNTPIQGTSADMIKLAMLRIDKLIRDQKLRSRMILQVHDELIFDVPDDESSLMKELVSREMKAALELDVPIDVDVQAGPNWAEI